MSRPRRRSCGVLVWVRWGRGRATHKTQTTGALMSDVPLALLAGVIVAAMLSLLSPWCALVSTEDRRLYTASNGVLSEGCPCGGLAPGRFNVT